jgi:hypothetical protein
MNQQKEQLATRIVSPLGRRLRVYAALRGLAITDVVSAALDGYLPPLTDMVRSPEGGTVVPQGVFPCPRSVIESGSSREAAA